MSDDQEDFPSKSQLKRMAHEAQEMGERLVELPAKQLAQIEMPPELEEAVMQARNMPSRGAHKRQLQYIGKVMRHIDLEPITRALQRMDDRHHEGVGAFHEIEHMRDRLIDNMDETLEELLNRFPDIDRQHIRQLVRNTQAELKKNKPPKSKRQLFQFLKQIMSEQD